MSDNAVNPSARSVTDRAAVRTMRERRRRVWRNVGVFLLVTSLMVVVSMAHRDHQAVRGCRERMTFARDRFQELLGTVEPAPDQLPLPGLEADDPTDVTRTPGEDQVLFDLRMNYLYNSDYWRQARRRRPVGVCCNREPHRLYLQANGRHVIVFDGDKYELLWMTEPEFRERAAELGFSLPEGP